MEVVIHAAARIARRSSSSWKGPGLAQRMEYALFAITLAATGYLCLGPLVAAGLA